jgi:hypothetical protein
VAHLPGIEGSSCARTKFGGGHQDSGGAHGPATKAGSTASGTPCVG